MIPIGALCYLVGTDDPIFHGRVVEVVSLLKYDRSDGRARYHIDAAGLRAEFGARPFLARPANLRPIASGPDLKTLIARLKGTA
jgi:hypothetical protein